MSWIGAFTGGSPDNLPKALSVGWGTGKAPVGLGRPGLLAHALHRTHLSKKFPKGCMVTPPPSAVAPLGCWRWEWLHGDHRGQQRRESGGGWLVVTTLLWANNPLREITQIRRLLALIP